jgi:hypothetical protein
LRQHIREAGQKPPGIFAFLMQSLRSRISPKQWVFLNAKPGLRKRRPPPPQKASCTGKPSARFPTVEGGLLPIACGADSVASALHLRSGATPRGRAQIIMTLRAGRSKEELFILHKTGTYHFALTLALHPLTPLAVQSMIRVLRGLGEVFSKHNSSEDQRSHLWRCRSGRVHVVHNPQ